MKRRTFLKWAIATPALGVATFTQTEIAAQSPVIMGIDPAKPGTDFGAIWYNRENGGIWVLPQLP